MAEDVSYLRQFATPRQLEYLNTILELGSYRATAKKFGVTKARVQTVVKSLKARAVAQGVSPSHGLTHEIPSPLTIKGTSTLYNESGGQVLQWVKTKLSDEWAQEAIKDWIASLAEEIRGCIPVVAPPALVSDDLLAAYPFGDPHIGMYAWGLEAGEDFDLSIAKRIMCGAIDRVVTSAPPAKVGLVLILGDTFHANDQTNVTPGHKHQLDVDSRYPKVIMVGIEAVRHVIQRALEKHELVIVRIEPGNHDPQAKWALAFALAMAFENNPRVTIDLSPSKFWYYRFGKVLIGTTHGDTIKHEALPSVMAADKPNEWGKTKHRYWYTGHVHHQAVKEFAGVTCESFRSLVAKDAYNTAHGYRSGRDLFCIVHHKDHGEIERHRCDVGMIS